jgi:hypothetical protein
MNLIYQFQINTNACNYELWLNDIRVDIQMADNPIVYDLLVNPWLKTGNNNLKIIMLPISSNPELSHKAYFKIAIVKGIPTDGKMTTTDEVKRLGSPDFKEMKENNPDLILNRFELNDAFIPEIEYKNLVFESLVPLNTSREELTMVYRRLHNLFLEKDKTSILALLEFKIREYAKSIYDTYENQVNRQSIFLDEMFSNNIEPLDFSKYHMTSFLGNSLYCLEDDEGDQPIFFTSSSDDYYTFYPFWFGKKDPHGDWIIGL